MRKIWFLFLACISTSTQLPGQDTTHAVIVSDLVANNVEFFYSMADKAKMETPFCMIGSVDSAKKVIQISELRLIAVDSASDNNVYFHSDGCNTAGAIGTVHFHTGISYCDLSVDDVVYAHDSNYPVIAIVCTEKAGRAPKLIVVMRAAYEAEWNKLKQARVVSKDSTRPPTTYQYARRLGRSIIPR